MADIYFIHQLSKIDNTREIKVKINGFRYTLRQLAGMHHIDYDELWNRVVVNNEPLHTILYEAATGG
jgi:hypothetical protein